MRRACIVTVASILCVISTTMAFAQPSASSSEIKSLARDIVQTGKLQPDDTPPDSDVGRDPVEKAFDTGLYVSSPGPTFVPPTFYSDGKSLWYDLGKVTIDLRTVYDLSETFESMASLFTDPDDLPDAYEYPLKAQLTVELIRKFRNTRDQQAQWSRPLQLAAAVVDQELLAIQTAVRSAEERPRSEFEAEEDERVLYSLLNDHDAHLTRIVIGHLDEVAAASGLVLRKHRPTAQGAFQPEPYQVRFSVADPEAQFFVLSRFDYLVASLHLDPARTGGKVEQEISLWKPVTPRSFPAGQNFVLAVWPQASRYSTPVLQPVKVVEEGQFIQFGVPRPTQFQPSPKSDVVPAAPAAEAPAPPAPRP